MSNAGHFYSFNIPKQKTESGPREPLADHIRRVIRENTEPVIQLTKKDGVWQL